jgi:putative heme iron utilization protein
MAERRSQRAEQVRELLRAQKAGVLCTISAKLHGAPFGSLASYALSERGEPLFLFSNLSQHTQNVAADPRGALFVCDLAAGGDDPQTAPRACLVGVVEALAAAEEGEAQARYLERHPHAEPWLELDFRFHRLTVQEVQLVGGFAQAAWVPAAEILG